jgi:hypothetical protein
MITLKHCYPTRCTTLKLPPGLGDYLRGSIALAHHARERGWKYELDFSGHPIGRFLAPAAPPQASAEPIAEFFDEQASTIYGWLDGLTDGQTARACTNLLPHDSRIDDEVRAMLRAALHLAPAILQSAQAIHQEVAGQQALAVLHVRATDADFRSVRDAEPALCRAIEQRVLPAWGRRVAVLSNNPALRAGLCRLYGFTLIDSATVHLGACDADDQGVRDTLVDFALICRAQHVFSHSAYGWKSGFSYWAAVMHGISFESLREQHSATTPAWKQGLKNAIWRLEAH